MQRDNQAFCCLVYSFVRDLKLTNQIIESGGKDQEMSNDVVLVPDRHKSYLLRSQCSRISLRKDMEDTCSYLAM